MDIQTKRIKINAIKEKRIKIRVGYPINIISQPTQVPSITKDN